VNLGWYDPPEPMPCCRLGEDDPDHDVQACLDESAEAAAEAKAERRTRCSTGTRTNTFHRGLVAVRTAGPPTPSQP
jgi:hypothetical protein